MFFKTNYIFHFHYNQIFNFLHKVSDIRTLSTSCYIAYESATIIPTFLIKVKNERNSFKIKTCHLVIKSYYNF